MQDTYGIWILHSGKMLRYHLLTGLNRDKRFNQNSILNVFLQFTLKVSRIPIEKNMIFFSQYKSERNLTGISLRLLADSLGILITTTKLHTIDQQHQIAY